MKHLVDELNEALLDAAVAMAAGMKVDGLSGNQCIVGAAPNRYIFSPSRKWDHGGPIIEREMISIACVGALGSRWYAEIDGSRRETGLEAGHVSYHAEGDTALQAAMRAFVKSKLGNTVEL